MNLKERSIARAFVELLEKTPDDQRSALLAAVAELLHRHGVLRSARTFPALVLKEWQKRTGALRVTLTLPQEDAEAQRSILSLLEKTLARPCLSETRHDASMLGGVVLKVGDERFDLSLKRELLELSDRVSHSLPAFAEASAGEPLPS